MRRVRPYATAEVSQDGVPPSASPVLVEVQCRFEILGQGIQEVFRAAAHRVRASDTSESAEVVLYEMTRRDLARRLSLGKILGRPAPVVVMTETVRPEHVAYLRGLGVRMCVSPQITGVDLVGALEVVAGRPGATLPRSDCIDQACTPPRRGERGPAPSSAVALTVREAEVLDLIAQGMSNAQIATTLFLGINSVKTHVRKAYRKIGVRSRSQAVLWTLHHDLGSPDDPPQPA